MSLMKSIVEEQADRRMYSHSCDVTTAEAMTKLRGKFRGLFVDVGLCTAECREKSIALTKLEESLMWTMAALARPLER